MKTLFWVLNYIFLFLNAFLFGVNYKYSDFFYEVEKHNLAVGSLIVNCRKMAEEAGRKYEESNRIIKQLFENKKGVKAKKSVLPKKVAKKAKVKKSKKIKRVEKPKKSKKIKKAKNIRGVVWSSKRSKLVRQ